MTDSPPRLFGTDGIRGLAGEGPLHPEALQRLGRVLAQGTGGGAVLIGRDTRVSGEALEAALAAGLAAGGVSVRLGGVLPTPWVAGAVAEADDVALGIVISASHNPPAYNGVKVLGRDGRKLSREQERTIEEALAGLKAPFVAGSTWGRVTQEPLATRWVSRTLDRFQDLDLNGLRLGVDPGHGALCGVATHVLEGLGASVEAIHDLPDGTRINVGGGAVHPQALATRVVEARLDAGFAFDGDGDRVIVVAPGGEVLDGDRVLAILAQALRKEGRLPGDLVVATVMAGAGLERWLTEHRMRLVRTPVGDRHVAARMREMGAGLGGEPSGHVILADRGPTGDGLGTALELLRASLGADTPLDQLAPGYRAFPQRLVNVPVTHRPPLEKIEGLEPALQAADAALAGRGRQLLRYSGTEPLLRILVEADDPALVETWSEQLAAIVARAIGEGGKQ